MAVLALDIGTTKICALVMDEESGAVLETLSADNAFLPAARPREKIQDPEKIVDLAGGLVSALKKKYRTFRCIGVTAQMHGIIYVDLNGRALSPLYTWQDAGASLPLNTGDSASGESYAEYLARFSPGPIAPGYGLATCFYHQQTKQIPPGAAQICTIGDYAASRLCAAKDGAAALPVMHATNAGGMGFFDLHDCCFDEKSMERAGLDPCLLPKAVSGTEVLGEFEGIPVCVSIGDNQASFLGSVRDSRRNITINLGTGGQLSLVSPGITNPQGLEPRPFFEGNYLLVGASLCGGRAYALLEKFFRQVLEMAGHPCRRAGESSLYDAMDAAVEAAALAAVETAESPLVVNTLFAGSRADPCVRGSILNISEDNFTPAKLAAGFLNGAVQELYNFYEPFKNENDHQAVVGAGNGIRKCRPLRRIITEKFGMPLEIPLYREEAAYGAALFALTCTGYFKTVFQAQRLVRYEKEHED